ncbi:hypothetical protein PTSG_12071 [Salpingoeca rosetta]|uniref:Uncharacterized protein n=1 Tax=Salpingoeca rosetta (strain ATCC 50818 / BSB-021) TaxID=946362 RepID=F2U6G7_SALR5|nr:uncharacterized protein PTSG_12071 [Salpingoeca rosetta]EGD83108.1 hypothetical protein PTSG_12071 [Salpingoeca rosetta]|eukprot:XP_004995472.1 hypothetical protein PTSG_12071 [Salpingoeca rosetta]
MTLGQEIDIISIHMRDTVALGAVVACACLLLYTLLLRRTSSATRHGTRNPQTKEEWTQQLLVRIRPLHLYASCPAMLLGGCQLQLMPTTYEMLVSFIVGATFQNRVACLNPSICTTTLPPAIACGLPPSFPRYTHTDTQTDTHTHLCVRCNSAFARPFLTSVGPTGCLFRLRL